MHLLARTLALLAPLVLALPAPAQEFPSRPITLICPWPPGGSTDTHLRRFAEVATRYLGQTIVIENKPGAGGTIGMGAVAQNAKPEDRKSTRLNSSHMSISYAVFCLKKKKKITNTRTMA